MSAPPWAVTTAPRRYGDGEHTVKITGHRQDTGMQYRVVCSCGWQTWNISRNGAEVDALEHHRAATTAP